VLVPLVCTCLGCGSTSVFCAGDEVTEGGSLRGALQPWPHVARGIEGVAARRKAGEGVLLVCQVWDCVQCHVCQAGNSAVPLTCFGC
jgi:hypothetical protein